MEVVYVRWLDARGIQGPVSLAAGKRQHPIMMHSGGLLVDESEERVVLAQDWWDSTEDGGEVEWIRDLEVVPRALIQVIQRFTIGEVGDEKAP